MHPTAAAVEHYHQLLRQSDAPALWARFQEQMRENLLYFGDRAICNVLRPQFLHPREYDFIAEATAHVTSALHKIYAALRAGELDCQRLLHLSPAEAALVALPDVYGHPDVSARMDAFWLPGPALDQGNLYFLEYNADSPGGLGYGDVLGDLFAEFEPMRGFAQRYRLTRPAVRSRVYRTLLETYRDWCQATERTPVERPNIAIVDWRSVRTRNEFLLSRQVFEAAGSRVVICDPDKLTLREGRLWAGDDFPVEIVYKRVVVNELIKRYPDPAELLAQPLVQAVAQNAVCIANHFNCQLLYNKALFALISDEENQHRFSPAEQAAVRRHVPWSRLVADQITRFDGAALELVELIRQRKDELVLKPVREYGGTGVVLGWETDASSWESALQRALVEPHVVQRRVPTPSDIFPVWQEGALHFAPRMVDVDPYVWRGSAVEHAGVRLGTSALLNVSAGGGSAVPLFLAEAKTR
ncbi:MAG: circularly permuted type 2 ATP-grasp protein [Caldilineaceae bacterium]|nr:circularly permuted type 2 ATP-grasp protein [Caldilineaceae bacterium]